MMTRDEATAYALKALHTEMKRQRSIEGDRPPTRLESVAMLADESADVIGEACELGTVADRPFVETGSYRRTLIVLAATALYMYAYECQNRP